MPSILSPNDYYQHSPGRLQNVQNLDWSLLRTLNNYRSFLLIVLAAVVYLSEAPHLLGQRNPVLFNATHAIYLTLALVFGYFISKRLIGLESQFYIQSYLDIVFLSILIHASGGVTSGTAILMVIQIVIIANCLKPRYALLFTAIATCMLLSQELASSFLYGENAADLTQTAMICGSMFLLVMLTGYVLKKGQSETPPDIRQLSMKRIAELNREIIQELESGVLYVDTHDNIQIANETAGSLLNIDDMDLPIGLGLASPSIYRELSRWKKTPTMGNRSIETADGRREVLPSFTPLSNGGILIKLEDNALIRQQLQQLKLASLGRLSASIAHEVRNPLGAVSHSIQLLKESNNLTEDDLKLVNIAENHSGRINRIVNDVLHLASHPNTCPEIVDLADYLPAFATRFCKENNLQEATISVSAEPNTRVQFDTHHLDQILWNLCFNSMEHNKDKPIEIEISTGHDTLVKNAISVDVSDNGVGIKTEDQHSVFEPFFTTSEYGSGLGLYLIKGLCELNQSSIQLVPQYESGTRFRIVMPIALEMAA